MTIGDLLGLLAFVGVLAGVYVELRVQELIRSIERLAYRFDQAEIDAADLITLRERVTRLEGR